jgi:hypothetical protein
MQLEPGQIIKNLIPAEPVTIIKVQPLGASLSITYTGVNSNRTSSKVISQSDLAHLELLTTEGSFNFQGDPVKFALFAEAERINSAYQFDPLFAVNCSIVDPLPHQVEAVYKFLLPLPKIRFCPAKSSFAPQQMPCSAPRLCLLTKRSTGQVKTNKFNALWIFSSLLQGRLVKRHKRGVEHGILG